jgi:D-lyxose ketol-isomerase
MLTQEAIHQYRKQALVFYRRAGIVVTEAEQERIEIADFRLGRFEQTGLAVLVYVNTERCCAKELAMWPHQTCPEHRHPPVGNSPGKEETFRCRWGKIYLYVPGQRATTPKAVVPAGNENCYTVWREIELNPGEQYTLAPNTLHWFQAGSEGAVVSEFSTRSTDENDVFTDSRIVRV